MRQNPHVRICGGPGSATTLVYPTTMRAHASTSGSSGAGKTEISARMALVVLAQLIDLYMLIVLGAVIISWLKLPPTNTVAIVLHRLTEPALGPIRRVLPQVGGLDFSPLVLLIALQFLRRLL